MNKLISRNPVLRFKLGKKILKFGGGDRFLLVGYTYFPGLKSFDSEYVFYDRNTGNLLTSNIPNITSIEGTVNRGNNYSRYGYSWNSEEYKPKKSSNINLDLDPNRVAKRHDYDRGQVTYTLDKNGIWYAKWNSPNLPNQGYYRVAEGSTGYNKAGDHNVLRNGQWVKIEETPAKKVTPVTPSYKFGKMGGWNRSMGNSIDQDSLNILLEMGYNIDNINAQTIQNEINKVFGSNAVKADNKWGNLSRAGLLALYNKWKKELPINSAPELPTSQQLVEHVQKNQIKPIETNVLPIIYLQTHDLTNGFTLTSTYNPTKTLTIQMPSLYEDMLRGKYKIGGQLPSRNVVKRFKNRKFN